MKIYIGADHRGYKHKERLVDFLGDQGHDIIDVGTHDGKKGCDYPKIGYSVATRVAEDKNSRGTHFLPGKERGIKTEYHP